jgi:hypothetical protein
MDGDRSFLEILGLSLKVAFHNKGQKRRVSGASLEVLCGNNPLQLGANDRDLFKGLRRPGTFFIGTICDQTISIVFTAGHAGKRN